MCDIIPFEPNASAASLNEPAMPETDPVIELAHRIKAIDVEELKELAACEFYFDDEEIQILSVVKPKAFWRYVADRAALLAEAAEEEEQPTDA